MGNKRLFINLAANSISFLVNFAISFILSPFIIENVGSDAYGFFKLSGDFVSYASLITIALNSMAGRFVTIKIHQGDTEGANRYFNSVFISNVIMSVVLLIPSVFMVLKIDSIINVPSELLGDIKLLFAFAFGNFILTIISSVFGMVYFTKNRLDISSIRDIIFSLLRMGILIYLFSALNPRISYMGLTAFVITFFSIIVNIYYTKKLCPELIYNKKYFDTKSIKELIVSGVWNVVTRISQLLLDGLDLLISNLFIGAAAMGTLAVAKTVPTFISSLVGMLAGVFSPNFTILYAKGNKQELITEIKKSMKILGFFTGIPIALLIGLGDIFYKLWIPNQDAVLLQQLSVITIAPVLISGCINSIYNIFTVTNKLKANSYVMVFTGILSTAIVFILIKTTNLGVFAVAGVSTVLGVVRNLTFTPIYGAKCIDAKWYTFYSEIFRSVFSILISSIIIMLIKSYFNLHSWLLLFLLGIACTLICLIINWLVILGKSERIAIFDKMMKMGRRA